ncbi:MAG: hypothetical protein LBQ92_05670 [Propionibacteriaceae bacterium]|jgi:hypothetical protein|nr:hypothetical protein [Propionibacteriaceae bacterium]
MNAVPGDHAGREDDPYLRQRLLAAGQIGAAEAGEWAVAALRIAEMRPGAEDGFGDAPGRVALLHLDGSQVRLPEVGAPVTHNGEVVGTMGTSARHHELGPIGLAKLHLDLPTDIALQVDGVDAVEAS